MDNIFRPFQSCDLMIFHYGLIVIHIHKIHMDTLMRLQWRSQTAGHGITRSVL